jgi:glycosyltransferase involved in cell wall biosynthesis
MARFWILQIAEPLPCDGNARMLRSGILADQISKNQNQVVWFSGRFDHSRRLMRQGPSRIKINDNLEIRLLLGVSYSRNISLSRIINHTLAAVHFLVMAISLPKPDAVIISYPAPELAFCGSLFAKLFGIPTVIDYRDGWPEIFYDYMPRSLRFLIHPVALYYKLLFKSILRFGNVRLLIATSERLLSLACSHLPYNSDISRAMYSLAYPDTWSSPELSVSHQPEKEQNKLRVAYVGSLGHSYDIDIILEIASLLKDRIDIEFVFAGQGEQLQKLENAAHILKNVKVLGWLDRTQLNELLMSSHVGIMIIKGGTLLYTLPNKFAEYLCFSLPIISNIGGEVAELLSKEQVGINYVNPAQCSEWLIELINNNEGLGNLRSKARRLFDAKYSAQTVYAEMINQIFSVCGIESPSAGSLS